MNRIDYQYRNLLSEIINFGESVTTRGHSCKRLFLADFYIHPDESPLLLSRKVAWRTALREYEWFCSGDIRLPDHKTLKKWWAGQMNVKGEYPYGYGQNLRKYTTDHLHEIGNDQLKDLINGLRHHPNSRRHVITLWNPMQAEYISGNKYSKMPTTCHGTMMQFFVSEGKLYMKHYQRSADMMLGVPHNFVQYQAFQLYLCDVCGLEPGYIKYELGDCHIYEQHLEAAKKLVESEPIMEEAPQLVYSRTSGVDRHNVPLFLASDFSLDGEYKPSNSDSLPLIV